MEKQNQQTLRTGWKGLEHPWILVPTVSSVIRQWPVDAKESCTDLEADAIASPTETQRTFFVKHL